MENNKEKEQYYDSDIASVNEDDFLSDNEPPTQVEGEKRIIKKQKYKRVYKSIYRLGYHIDKPAPFDRVTLKYQHFQTKPQNFPKEGEFITYNLGLDKNYFQIEQFVTTMSFGEASIFEIEILKMCDKTNIKILDRTYYFAIDLQSYTTVIDLDNDRIFMKQIQNKGIGHFRVSECDEVIWDYSIQYKDKKISHKYEKPVTITDKLIWDLPRSVWRMLQTMKQNQSGLFQFDTATFQKVEGSQFLQSLTKQQFQKHQEGKCIKVKVHVESFVKVDDILFTQKLLKKTVRKGNSTNKASEGSIIYYVVGFFDQNDNLIKQDTNFSLDLDDLEQLKKIECRTHYLDQLKCSQMLRHVLTRIKPLQIAELRCYDKNLITYGWDYNQLISLFKEIPEQVHMKIKVFNFSDQKTAYNTTIEQKLFHCNRKKSFGLKYIEKSQFLKAKQVFDYMLSFFDSGIQTQEEKQIVKPIKLSSLMNSSLCALKLQNYQQVIELCIKAKQLNNSQKCVYRLAYAYKKTSQAQKGLNEIDQWKKTTPLNTQLQNLRVQLEADLQKYNQKSKAIYSNMFGN